MQSGGGGTATALLRLPCGTIVHLVFSSFLLHSIDSEIARRALHAAHVKEASFEENLPHVGGRAGVDGGGLPQVLRHASGRRRRAAGQRSAECSRAQDGAARTIAARA